MRRFLTIAFFLALIILGVCFYIYRSVIDPNFKEGTLYLPNSGVSTMMDSLEKNNLVQNNGTLKRSMKLMSIDSNDLRPGRYEITSEMSNRDFLNMVRSGRQQAVRFTLPLKRKIAPLTGAIAEQFRMDSTSLHQALLDHKGLQDKGYQHDSLMTLFVPNTYEVYWTTSPSDFVDRMIKENERFWTTERQKKARELGLSQKEIYTLASIVDKETNGKAEKPIVAGLYLNRLQRGIPLQADPTVVFANNDFNIRRVLNKHLAIDSPYNTYKNIGLPPGPIYMATIQGIDAVLNAKKHDYLFMCAKPDNSGQHAFAATLSQHNRNARAYQSWLTKRKILQ